MEMDEMAYYESAGTFSIDDLQRLPETSPPVAALQIGEMKQRNINHYESMLSDRGPNNELRGYLMKTAQNLSQFQRNKFFKRFYELDQESRQLKVFSKEGGQLKDTMTCDLTHVVTCLNKELPEDYKDFFARENYKDISIELPKAYSRCFALFFESGTIQMLFASNEYDFVTWTEAFKKMEIINTARDDVPFPKQSDENYFIATIYLCLLPPELTKLDMQSIKTDRKPTSQKMLDIEAENQIEVVVTANEVRGYLVKTVQEKGLLKKQKFLKRWYVLNAKAMTLYVSDKPNRTDDVTRIEFRTNRLAHVECNLSRKVDELAEFQSNSSATKSSVLDGRTEPIGLIFTNGNLMLLWAKPGKEFKYWTKAFKRLVQSDELQQKNYDYKSVFLAMKSENSYVLGIFRGLIPRIDLDFAVAQREELKTVEGWLVKTTTIFPLDTEKKPFLKAYCVLDFEKRKMFLCDSTNGQVVETIVINQELRFIDTKLAGRILKSVDHPLADNNVLQNLKLPLAYIHPFAIIFADGSLNIFWAQSEQEAGRWKDLFSKLIPQPDTPDFVNYITWSKQNTFLPTLYSALARKTHNDLTQIQQPPNELLIENVPNQGSGDEIKEEVDYRTNRGTQDDMVVGWLSRTQQKYPSWGGESFLYRFFKLNMLTGVLTEHQDQRNSRKLNEFVLFRKIVWVETELSNELENDHESVFQKNLQLGPPSGFSLPRDNVKPICLHMIDGDLILLWASAKREYNKWLDAFQTLRLPLIREGRQQILLRITVNNGFAASVFSSMKPIRQEVIQSQAKIHVEDGDSEIKGRCKKTAKTKASVKDRYYKLLIREKKLVLTKQEDELPYLDPSVRKNKTLDLRELRWVDTSLTAFFDPGFQAIFQRDVISLSASFRGNDEYFEAVNDFQYPIVLSFSNGHMIILWLEFEWERNHINEALLVIVQQGALSHDYVVQSKRNNFIASLFQALRRVNQQDEHVVRGVIGLSKIQSKSLTLVNKYITLDTRTGQLRIYTSAHKALEEEHDLRFAVLLQDQQLNAQLRIGYAMTDSNMVFAIHNAGSYLRFRAKNVDDFAKWTTAFAKVNMPEYHESELWVDGARNETLLPSNLDYSSSFQPNIHMIASQFPEDLNDGSYLCKTAQTLNKTLSKAQIFYKRYYTIDKAEQQLVVRNSADSKVKESYNLRELVKVDDGLMERFCPNHRLYYNFHLFRAQLAKLRIPKDFGYPFCLLFKDGSVQLLWAQSELERGFWTQALKLYLPSQTQKHLFFLRYTDNFLAVTMYLCLKPQTPAILLQTQFLVNQKEETYDSMPRQLEKDGINEEDPPAIDEKEQEQIEAMFSAQGSLEGWLYKTSQKVSFFQSELFHKRYYSLDLRQKQLKILSRPEGQLNQKINLDKQIMKVDDKLKKSLKNHEEEQQILGKNNRLPSYRYPFALYTTTDCFLLWAETLKERLKWVKAFECLMMESDPVRVQQFEVVEDTKNKFIFKLYKSLQEQPNLNFMHSQNVISKIASVQQDQLCERKDEENPVEQPAQFLTHLQPESVQLSMKQKVVDELKVAPRESKRDAQNSKENKTDQSHQNEQKISLQQNSAFDDQAAYQDQCIPEVQKALTTQRMSSRNTSIESIKIISQKGTGRKLRIVSGRSSHGPIKIKKMIPLKDMTSADVNVFDDENKVVEFTKKEQEGLHAHAWTIKETKPNFSRQVVDFTKRGQEGQPVHAQTVIKTEVDQSYMANESRDMSDDDLERDPAAEIIQAPFRMYRKTALSVKKLKIKMRGQSSKSSRLPMNEQFVSYQQNNQAKQQPGFLKSSWNRTAMGETQQPNFEEKVKGQVDKEFINTLLTQNNPGNRISFDSKSAWGNVAQNLRDQLKQQTKGLSREHPFNSKTALKAAPQEPVSMLLSHALPQRSPVLPIKVKAQNLNGTSATFLVQDQKGQEDEQELSDWDDDDHEQSKVVKKQRYSCIDDQKKLKSKNILINVRDSTSGLSNVFNSQIIKDAPPTVVHSINPKQAQPQQLFRRSFRRNVKPTPSVRTLPTEVESVPVKDLGSELDILKNKTDLNQANDCYAESYNSVWD